MFWRALCDRLQIIAQNSVDLTRDIRCRQATRDADEDNMRRIITSSLRKISCSCNRIIFWQLI